MQKDERHLVRRGALWLRPSGPALDRLQELIRRLTARFSMPWPRPHVSLLSGIELSSGNVEERLTALAQRMRPMQVKLGKLEGRNEHFRCFYAAVEPSAELMSAHQAACEIFEIVPTDPFEPHLSLLYGQLDAPTKERLAREFGGSLHLSFTATSVHLVNATAAVPVAHWNTLYEAPLRRPGRGERTLQRSANF
jgi:2'-5' RNA ligase